MTRARQVANFDPALFAADEVSGDKVSSGTIGGDTIVNTSGAITTSGALTTATLVTTGTVGIGVAADRELTVGGVENARIGIKSDVSGGACQLQFGDPENTQIGRIMYEHGSDNRMTFYTDDTEAMRIHSNSDIEVKAGDLIFGAAGKGINLGVTANTDANTLDDYEEGEFTPILDLSSVSFGTRYGRYTRIGDTVSIWTRITVNSHSSATTMTNHTLSGIPFDIDTTAYVSFGIFKTAAGADTGACVVNNSTSFIYRAPIANSAGTYYANVTYKTTD